MPSVDKAQAMFAMIVPRHNARLGIAAADVELKRGLSKNESAAPAQDVAVKFCGEAWESSRLEAAEIECLQGQSAH